MKCETLRYNIEKKDKGVINLYYSGKELGSGAFGMVLQATAYGISKPGVPQQVAVKMLKGLGVHIFDFPTTEKKSDVRSS